MLLCTSSNMSQKQTEQSLQKLNTGLSIYLFTFPNTADFAVQRLKSGKTLWLIVLHKPSVLVDPYVDCLPPESTTEAIVQISSVP